MAGPISPALQGKASAVATMVHAFSIRLLVAAFFGAARDAKQFQSFAGRAFSVPFRRLVLLRLGRRWQARRKPTARTQAITMLSAEKEAHCLRMLEHLTHMAASGQRFAAPTRTDPQFSIRLVGEVRRNDAEPRPTRRRRRRGAGTGQPDLPGI